MPVVRFTQNIQRHVACPERTVAGTTVREALHAYFAEDARVRSYVLDDRGAVRPHMIVFVDGVAVSDREGLSDRIDAEATIDVMQALSGG